MPATLSTLVRLSVGAAGLLLMSLVSAQQAEPIELAFGSFFRHPVGARGLEPGAALLAADGRDVRIVGYMVAREQPQPGRFELAPLPVRTSEQADGDADDLPPSTLLVLLDPAQRDRVVAHRAGPVALTGRLAVGRAEDAAGKVSWVRLLLPPQATAEQPLTPPP